ncbi:hypothetical protein ACWDD9_10375 [Kitasatospora sp. NPDC001119]
MPQFGPRTLVVIDNAADRDEASDGHSRYGAYLTQHADHFHDDGQPLHPVDFAITAWRTATVPVMAPGYVNVRFDVYPLDVCHDHNGGVRFCARVGLRHGDLARRPAGRPRPLDWERAPGESSHEQWPVLVEPERTDRPAVLVAATLFVPIPDSILVQPTTARPGRILTHEAKTVVAALAAHANDALAPLVNDLLGGSR